MAPCPLLETVVWHDLFLGRPRSRRYPKFKFNIRRDIPDSGLTLRIVEQIERRESVECGRPTSPPAQQPTLEIADQAGTWAPSRIHSRNALTSGLRLASVVVMR